MKGLFFILLLTLSGTTLALEPQDIIIKTRFDRESSSSFLKRLRTFLINNEFGDPFEQTFKRPMVIDLNKVLDDLPEDTRIWMKELQSLLRLTLFDSDFKLIVDEFYYSIGDFNSELRPIMTDGDRVEYVTLNYTQGLKLSAAKIMFQVELKKNTDGEPIKFSLEMLGPEFIVRPDLMVEMPMGWVSALTPQNLLLSLQSIDLQKVFSKILERPELIEFRVQALDVPKVSLKVGQKELKFDAKKINDFFIAHRDDIKKGILDIINQRMQDRLGNVIKDSPKNMLLPRTYVLDNKIHGVFDLQGMKVDDSGIMQLNLDGYFCPKGEGLEGMTCVGQEVEAQVRRVISKESFNSSMKEINRYMVEKDINIALSVSEHYLNQLIQSTIQAGLWKKSLEGKDFTLGPEKAFVLGEDKGDHFTLYLDIIYRLKGRQRILVGRSELRFPVKFLIGLKIVDISGMPHLQIMVKKVQTDEQLLLEGMPEYRLPTNVNSVPRFRNKVLKEILKEVFTFEGNILVDLEMNEFKGTYLEEVQFFSDGLGRATGVLTLGTKKDDHH